MNPRVEQGEEDIGGTSQNPTTLSSFSSSDPFSLVGSSVSVSARSLTNSDNATFSMDTKARFVACTPSATSASSRPLAVLRPMKLLPDRYTAGVAAIAVLKKIDVVRIGNCVERNNKLYYVIDVYIQRPVSRIPTTVRDNQQHHQSQFEQSSQHPSSSPLRSQWQACKAEHELGGRGPDFRLERTFSDFTRLRSKAYREAQRAHSIVRCDLCDNVVTATLLGANQPKRFMNLVRSCETLTGVLSDYLNELIEITVCSRRSRGSRACEGQEQIPQLLLAFFQPDMDARLS